MAPRYAVLAATAVLACAAPARAASGHLKWFGYWQSGAPASKAGYLQANRGSANLTMAGYAEITANAEAVFADARRSGMKVAVWLDQFTAWDYLKGPDFAARAWDAFSKKLEPYRDDIAFFVLADEPENGENVWITSPDWQGRKAGSWDWLKDVVPMFERWKTRAAGFGKPSLINYTADKARRWVPPYLISADIVSFDEYGCWSDCPDLGGLGFADFLKAFEAKFPKGTQFLLLPAASVPWSQRDQTAAQAQKQVLLADRFFALAQADPRVIGMLPWNWWNVPDAFVGAEDPDMSVLRDRFAAIGRSILGGSATATPTPTPTPTPTLTTGPVLQSLRPSRIDNGAQATVLVNGSNFAPGAVVVYQGPANGKAAADYVSSTQLRLTVGANQRAGLYQVAVKNPDGSVSTLMSLLVSGADSASGPDLSGISPSRVTQGTPANLVLTGSQFAKGATVAWSMGADQGSGAAAFVSAGELHFNVPKGSKAGTYKVRVANPDGRTSAPLAVTITPAANGSGTGTGGMNAAQSFLQAMTDGSITKANDPGVTPQVASAAAFHAYLLTAAQTGSDAHRALARELLDNPAYEKKMLAALQRQAKLDAGGGPGTGVDPDLGTISNAGQGKGAVRFIESMFAALDPADRKTIEDACLRAETCDVARICIDAGLYDKCLGACRLNPGCQWPSDTTAYPDPTACDAPDNTQPPGPALAVGDDPDAGKGGTICVTSNSGKGYFVVGPDKTWGWNNSHCFAGHVSGTYSVNTNGSYGYPAVNGTNVRANVSPKSAFLKDGGTIDFTVGFCEP